MKNDEDWVSRWAAMGGLNHWDQLIAASALLVVSGVVIAAPVSTDLPITVQGSVNTPARRTCSFGADAANQAEFVYRRDAIPNYYFVWGGVGNFSAATTGSSAKYFRLVDYSVICTFLPTENSISIVYRVIGGNIDLTASGGNFLANYIPSTTNSSAGFYVCARTDSGCLNFRDILSGAQPFRVASAEFVRQPSGAYRASINYAVAFVGLNPGANDFANELVGQDIVAAGGYMRDLTLDITYN